MVYEKVNVDGAAPRAGSLPRVTKLVLIDLDGTLIDTAPDLAAAINHMLAALHLPCASEGQVRGWIGSGISNLIRRALHHGGGDIGRAQYDRALGIFLGAYGNALCVRSRTYGGAVEALQRFRQHGVCLACITNKRAAFTLPLLEQLNLHHYFDLVLCGDSLERTKPDPLPLTHAAGRFGVDLSECVMVGDSITDVAAARGAAMSVICVNYGYNGGVDVEEFKPDAAIDSLLELFPLLGLDA